MSDTDLTRISLLVTATLLNLAAVLSGRGSFLHIVAVLMTLVYVALPACLVAAVAWLLRRRHHRLAAVARGFSMVAIVAGSTVISGFLGVVVAKHDVARAQQHCEALLPALDRYHAQHGQYPATLALVGAPRPPWLLRDGTYYRSDGATFAFSFTDPAAMMGGFRLDAAERQWQYED